MVKQTISEFVGFFHQLNKIYHKDSFFYIYGDIDDPITKYYHKHKLFYEYDLLLSIDDIISNSKGCIIDCGANIGNHSIFFGATYPIRRIFAFEPNPITYDLLIKNIYTNNLNNITAIQRGLGKINRKYKIVENPQNKLGGVSLKPDSEGVIEVTQLDTYSEQFDKVALIKIDVEGMELDVLEGSRHIIKTSRPSFIIETKDIETYKLIYSFLKEYSIFPITVKGDAPTTIFVPLELRNEHLQKNGAFFLEQLIERCIDDYKWARLLLKSNGEIKTLKMQLENSVIK